VHWRRTVLVVALVTAAATAAAWYWQSALIGWASGRYLAAIAAAEDASGDLSERRQAVHRVHRMLLVAAPADALVPELFDLLTALSPRVSQGAIDLDWAAYVYTSYWRDLRQRDGRPRRSPAEIEEEVERYVRFFSLRQRPDVPGLRLGDLTGAAQAESYTVEEIERAHREGRPLP